MINWKTEWKKLAALLVVFLACFYIPVQSDTFRNAIFEAFTLVRWYAREHVLLCLLPAFFIAGAIAVFIKQQSVMKYLGAGANKILAYGVASVSGTILAVCSCTVLPLFAGIYKMGAGLGPACTFLYSGPAINVLAIILTATILGPSLGIARAIGAVSFSIIIGLLMQLIFRNEESERMKIAAVATDTDDKSKSLGQTAVYFAAMVAILVFANWGAPSEYKFSAKAQTTNTIKADLPASFDAVIITPKEEIADRPTEPVEVEILTGKQTGTRAKIHLANYDKVHLDGFFYKVWKIKWKLVIAASMLLGIILIAWFKIAWWKIILLSAGVAASGLLTSNTLIAFATGVIGLAFVTNFEKGQSGEWFASTWTFTKQIIPLLIGGVFVAGFLLGQPHTEGIIPAKWVSDAVGGNSISANFLASVAGAFMYFATLTEVPILQALMGSGMGKGPALALLLAGPALSLPNMLVIRSVMGTKKTAVYVMLVVAMSTITGMIYGNFI